MRLILAISGGIDSTVLLDAFARGNLSELINNSPCLPAGRQLTTHNSQLTIAHFNHRIHTKADAHEKFVAGLAQKYALPFHVGRAKTKLASEAAARAARYEFLRALQKKLGAEAVVTAHHADDQIETILFNLVRGSGLAGLGGMSELKTFPKELTIFRPLLDVSKKQIEKYARKHRLKFVTDPTNTDEKYARNFLRQKVVPLLTKLNPKFDVALLRTAKQARATDEFLRETALTWIGKNRIKNCKLKICSALPLAQFLKLNPILASAVIRAIHRVEIGNLQRLEEIHVAEILTLARSGVGNKEKPFGRLIFRTRRIDGERVLEWGKNLKFGTRMRF